MPSPLPDQLSLTEIPDGAEAQAAPLRNNFSAIVTAFNLLRAMLGGGAAGQVLQAVDGTDVQWGIQPGDIVAKGRNASSATTSGSTFAAGADLLAAAISFTADGVSDYLVQVHGSDQTNPSSATHNLRLNLDGADGGQLNTATVAAGTAVSCEGGCVIVAPTAGAHTVNVRLFVTAGTGTIEAGAGGVGAKMPILVTVTKLG